MAGSTSNKEWLAAAEVATYLGIEPITIYRWCRAGRLPCIKLGKEWRIRRSALEGFLRRAEQAPSLVDHLRTFYTVPDHVIVVAETESLLIRLDAAFLQIGEAQGAVLVKFYGGQTTPLEQMRDQLTCAGLDVHQLEAVGRLHFVEETDSLRGRPNQLRQRRDALARERQSLWASFNWTEQVALEEALRQQVELASLVDSGRITIQTGVLERVMDDWSVATERRARMIHRGMIWVSSTGLSMTRMAPLPAN